MGPQPVKLTQRRIVSLECPPGRKDMLVFDDEQRGLGVRVTAGGKSYLAQYSFGGESDGSRSAHVRRSPSPTRGLQPGKLSARSPVAKTRQANASQQLSRLS